MLALTAPHRTTIALAFAMVLSSGCGKGNVTRSSLRTTIGARQVNATIDGAAAISQYGGHAVITFDNRQLVIEPTRVVFDGKELAHIAEAANKVEVDYSGGRLEIKADDEIVWSEAVQR